MRQERRSRWYLWSCDRDGCKVTATTHPGSVTNEPVEEEETPAGWIVVEPPRFWRGSALAFCSTEHRNEWAQQVVGPLLLGRGEA